MTSCQEYFIHTDTDTFRGHYVAILAPYNIDPADAASPAAVVQVVYAAPQEGSYSCNLIK